MSSDLQRTAADDWGTTQCPECDGELWTSNDAEVVCRECGVIVSEHRVDHGPDWRRGDAAADTPARAHRLDETRHDDGLTTEISWSDHGLSASQAARANRIRREQKRLNSKKERMQIRLLITVRQIGSRLELPDAVTDDAAVIARRAHGTRHWGGVSIEFLAAAALYVAARAASHPLRPKTLVDATGREDLAVASVLRYAHEFASDHVARVASAVDATDAERRAAFGIAAAADDSPISVAPSSIAAAAVYHAALVRRGRGSVTQGAVGETVDRSPSTIQNTLSKLADHEIIDRVRHGVRCVGGDE